MTPAADELRTRLSTSKEVNALLIDSLRSQTEAIRAQDKQYGAGALLEQMRGHVNNIEQHLGHAIFESLATVLADAAALPDGRHLMSAPSTRRGGSSRSPVRPHYRTRHRALRVLAGGAGPCARRPRGSPGGADLADSVWTDAAKAVAPAMQCWLGAAVAEMHATAGGTKRAMEPLAAAESSAEALDGSCRRTSSSTRLTWSFDESSLRLARVLTIRLAQRLDRPAGPRPELPRTGCGASWPPFKWLPSTRLGHPAHRQAVVAVDHRRLNGSA